MAKLINCECGYVVRGSDEDDVVRNAEEHISQAHPELVGQMSREDLLAMAQEA